jgi:uncharacterized membrane protein
LEKAMKVLRKILAGLVGLGLLSALVTAAAGPFGFLRDLRYPLLFASLFYLFLSAVERRWAWGEKIKRILEHPCFPWGLTAAAGFVFARIKILEWRSGDISGVDFSHLDYAIWNTAHGRFMDVSILSSHPTFLDMFGNHYSPILYVHVLARIIYDSPVSSLLVHALSLAAAVPVLHALARKLTDGLSASVLSLVYVFCGAVAATLQFEIHQESFFPLGFGLVFLGLFSRFGWAVLGAVVVLAVKEDAGIYLAPLFFWAAVLYPARRWASLAMGVASLAWLVFALKVAMPWHQPPAMGTPSLYFFLWEKYGTSYGQVAVSMLKHPHWVAADVFLNPSLYKNLLPWGFLPLASPLGLIAFPPAAILSTATAYPPMRSFGLYYGIVLVPIFFAAAAHTLGRFRSVQRRWQAAWLLFGLSAFVGGAFLRFPAPKPDFAQWLSVGAKIEEALPGEKLIWVQSGLLPYLPYGTQWRRIDNIASLPPAGNGPLAFFRTLKADSIEVPWEQIEDRLAAKGYRKVAEEGDLRLFR